MSPDGRMRHFLRKWRKRQAKNFDLGIWEEAGRALLGQAYWDRGGGPEDTIYLAGHGRSGTTWVAEILNFRNEYRYIHEPFHPGRLAISKVYRPRQYLRPANREPRYLEPARAIVSGQVRSLWGDKYNRKVLPRKRLIKEVRNNLLLPWLHQNFPEMPMVVMLRHPCAVANSQRRLAQQWKVDLNRFLDQEDLMTDYLAPFAERIAAAHQDFEKRIFVWCIENYVPLEHLRRSQREGELHIAFYEHFCLDPATEIERMFGFLGIEYDPNALACVAKPSPTSLKDSAVLRGGDLVGGWRQGVTDLEVETAMEILGLFGLDRIYSFEPMPNPDFVP
jgi:hypothetical protein